LKLVNPDDAKSIIILAPDHLEDEEKDIYIMKKVFL